MAEKPIKHDELIESNIFEPTRKEAELLSASLEKLIIGFKSLAVTTGRTLPSATPKTIDELKALEKALADLNKLEQGTTEARKQLLVVNERLRIARQAEKDDAKGMISAYSALNNEYKKAAQNAKDLAAAHGVNSKAAKEAAAQAKALNDRLKSIDASIGNHQRNVGNYGKAVQNLEKGVNGLSSVLGTLGNAVGINTQGLQDMLMAGRDMLETTKKLADAKKAQTVVTQGATLAEAASLATIGSVSVGLIALTAIIYSYVEGQKFRKKVLDDLAKVEANHNANIAEENRLKLEAKRIDEENKINQAIINKTATEFDKERFDAGNEYLDQLTKIKNSFSAQRRENQKMASEDKWSRTRIREEQIKLQIEQQRQEEALREVYFKKRETISQREEKKFSDDLLEFQKDRLDTNVEIYDKKLEAQKKADEKSAEQQKKADEEEGQRRVEATRAAIRAQHEYEKSIEDEKEKARKEQEEIDEQNRRNDELTLQMKKDDLKKLKQELKELRDYRIELAEEVEKGIFDILSAGLGSTEKDMRKKQMLAGLQAASEIAKSFLKTYNNYLDKGDTGKVAFQKATHDVFQAKIFAKALSGKGLYEGTEEVTKDHAVMTIDRPKDPFLVPLHQGERVMSVEDNRKTSGLTNKELAIAGQLYKNGVFSPIIDDDAPIRSRNEGLTALLTKELRELKDVVKNKRELNIDFNKQHEMIMHHIEGGIHKVITRKERKF